MPQRTTQLSNDLLKVLNDELPRLASFSETDAQTRLGGSEGWSRKQELGHLIDSALNNRVRFVTAALAPSYAGPTYDGDGWVTLAGYDSMPWETILNTWSTHNHGLVSLVANIPDEKLTVPCSIGSSPSVTLGFLIEDYILHMQHHLDHLVGREVSTSYPGAAMGV